MREEAIQWAWSKGLIAGKEYHSQEQIEILSQGNWNVTSPGPDFKFAEIKIGNLNWHGDVEIHLKSSDWVKHRHHFDPLYHRVILHVVAEYDTPIYLHGTLLPTLIVDAPLISLMKAWKANKKLACSFVKYRFTENKLNHFWEQRMLRKAKEKSIEIDWVRYLIIENTVTPQFTKMNGRQRNPKDFIRELEQIKLKISDIESVEIFHIKKLVDESSLTEFEKQTLIINGLIPYFFPFTCKIQLKDFSRNIRPEQNRIISLFRPKGINPINAFESQALLEIYRHLCLKHRCLTCEQGKQILGL